jgi:hypothetical protein
VVLFLALAGAVMASAPLALDPSTVRWSELHYRAKKLGLSAETTISFDLVRAAQSSRDLLTPLVGIGLAPANPHLVLLSLNDRVLGRRSQTRLWLEPSNAAALQRVKTYSGRKPRYKAYRFADNGVSIFRREPARGEKKLPPERWSEVSERHQEVPKKTGSGERLTDPVALFYLVAAARLNSTGDRVEAPIFSTKGTFVVELKAEATTSFVVDYVEVSARGERRVHCATDVLRVSADAHHLNTNCEEGELELLGLEGDVELLVDPALGVAVGVRGKAPVVGKTTVRLKRITLR